MSFTYSRKEMIKILNDEFYLKVDNIITELTGIIYEYTPPENYKEVCKILRGLGKDTYYESDIQYLIEQISKLADICPRCGGEWVYKSYFEKHYELDGYNDLEEIGHYECTECGFKDE